ncbi:MAG TPA: aminotransferase class I/II-fold pyridoxal phosphate-dependent enzyme [Polyangiaceae bacterium]|nr:aminotransferase class I/II-fold pyridoxal phosphate-dependent enzyme [Polyangiaceae bacterium]
MSALASSTDRETLAGGPLIPRIFLSPPDVGLDERQALLQAFDSNWIAPLGPEVDAFEADFARAVGAGHAAALSSGTAGLHLGLILLGVQPEDEVFVPTLTFVATANAVAYVGARPFFLDVDRKSWTLDPVLLEQALSARAREGRLPKAVISVDLYGQCANYTAIRELCQAYGVPLLQDAAEALGATFGTTPAGTQGALGVFSFNGNKIITTSGGGMLVSNDAALIARARHLASQAREPALHYEHREVGYNYRMSNLLAALGRAQLRSLGSKVERRRSHFEAYRSALSRYPQLDFMPEAPWGRANRWLTCLTCASQSERDALIESLAAANIESRPVWKPLHLQPAFSRFGCAGGEVARDLFERGLCLPSGSSLCCADQARVIERLEHQLERRGGGA